jgi:hypothetical protein
MPVDAVYPWLLTPVLSCCTGGHGCNAHPAFPAPSFVFEGGLLPTPRAKSRRENTEVWQHERRLKLICRPGEGRDHSHRTRFCESRLPSFLHPRTPVVMDPGLRRDDEKEGPAGRERATGGKAIRSPFLTIFWHCGFAAFSFRTRLWAHPGNEPSMVLAEDCVVFGSGNAGLRRKVRSSGRGGPGRSSSRARCCAAAHPPDRRASAS